MEKGEAERRGGGGGQLSLEGEEEGREKRAAVVRWCTRTAHGDGDDGGNVDGAGDGLVRGR